MDNDGVWYKTCCALNLNVLLYTDATLHTYANVVAIPTIFLATQEASMLLNSVGGVWMLVRGDSVVFSIYTHWLTKYNVTTVLIWALRVQDVGNKLPLQRGPMTGEHVG